jgi:polyisoprenoid-binding protein YceI
MKVLLIICKPSDMIDKVFHLSYNKSNKYKQIKQLFIMALLLMTCNLINAQIYNVESGSAFFKAKMSLNSYFGKSDQLHGTIDFETGALEFNVPLNSIKTGIKKRDKNMYELLNVEEYPTITFKGILKKIPSLTLQTKQAIKVVGDFTLAGTTQKVTIPLNFTPSKKGIELNATWSLLITNYNIERPRKFLFTVNDKHELVVNALLIEQ